MKLKLTKDLIFLDIESTGLNVIRDRILQIALVKYSPGREEPEELSMIINPGIPISEEAYQVHGIGPKEVANKPTFRQVASRLNDFIGNADLAGYNSDRFDIPILMEEFARNGVEFSMDDRRSIDVQKIFYRMEPRTLRAALKFYCGKELVDAHDALADVRATIDVLDGQLEKYVDSDLVIDDEIIEKPVRPEVKALSEFTTNSKMLDVTQRLKYNQDGVVVFNFGKYMGKAVGETLASDKQYYSWILNKEFSAQVKTMVRKLVKEYEEKKQ